MKAFAYPVIIDTDIGDDVDDTWALTFMLASDAFDVKLIVVSNNDVEYKACLVAKILTELERTDIPIAVGKGTPLPAGYVRGQGKWLGDFTLGDYAGTVYRGIDRAAEIIRQSPCKVCLFALGTCRTLADLLALDPLVVDNSVVYAMAGAVRKSYEGLDAVTPEFNVASDIAAARAVFDSGWDYTMLPLDVCAGLRLKGDLYRRLLESASPYARLIRDNYKAWLADAIFENTNDFAKGSSILYDMVVPWYALFPQYFSVRREPIYVDEKGTTKLKAGKPIAWALALTNTQDLFAFTVEQLCKNEV